MKKETFRRWLVNVLGYLCLLIRAYQLDFYPISLQRLGYRGTILLDDYISEGWLPVLEKDITGL